MRIPSLRCHHSSARRIGSGLCAVLSLGIALAIGTHVSPLHAQYLTRPKLPWQTVQTRHFAFHFPSEMREWTLSVARRMEAVATSVNAMVGSAPAARVTVLVEDPASVANGFALPFIEGPVIFLWPTPPSPSPAFSAYRGWGEAVAVHEYGHVAHLTIRSRNPNERLLWRLLPTQIGPVARKSPPWVFEGYATVIEGRLTGNGRPNSVGRPAVLRQWALEGKLPTYGQLNNEQSFLGGNMRYLAGSAFLEWLESRKGDSSLVRLWRRLSARQQRSFATAFAGVFGAPPEDLYGKFFVEVMAKSLEVEKQLTWAGLVEGQLVQKLNWGTGDPAVSPDGKLLALVLRSQSAPPRLVVWNTQDEPEDSASIRRRAAALRRDPLDVPAIDSFPRPKRAVATLHSAAGRSHEFPRWLPDNVHLLVSRDVPLGDGATRPDLFLWNHKTGGLRRVTRRAGIRFADPSPDGRTAAAVRCVNGVCGLVLVDLSSGRWRALVPGPAAAGSVETVWSRPRWSPDGSRIAASYHEGGRWYVALVDVQANGQVRVLDAGDGASRYAPTWSSRDELLVVSERGGIANLERIGVDAGRRQTLTRVTGGVLAPDVNRGDGRVYFLTLHAKGYDLRRLRLDSATTALVVVSLDPALSPAAPKRFPTGVPTFRPESLPRARDYGLGPRRWRVLPGAVLGADGVLGTLAIGNIDPIARLSVVAQVGNGERGTWRGGSLSAALRRHPMDFDASLWRTDHRPSEQQKATFAPSSADARYTAAGFMGNAGRELGLIGYGLRAGASVGTLTGDQLDAVGRVLAFAEARGRLTLTAGSRTVSTLVAAQATTGQTDGEAWSRRILSGSVVLAMPPLSVRGDALAGTVTAEGPAEFGRAFEQFLVGGSPVPYFDRAFISQRIPLPGVPAGYVTGRKLGMYRASLGGFPYEPYIIWVAAGDQPDDWKRIVGLERSYVFPALGFARLPQVRLRFGASFALNDPYRHKGRAYASLTYSP